MKPNFFVFVSITFLLSTSLIIAPSFLNELNYLKSVVSYSFSGLLSIFIFYRYLFKNKFSIIQEITIIDVLTFAFCASCVLKLPWDKQNWFWVATIGVYYISCRLLFSSLHWYKLGKIENKISIIAALVILVHVLLSIAQKIDILPSLHIHFSGGSTFGNPDMLASYLAFLIPFCFINNKKNNYFGIVVTSFAICMMVFIQARTALLSLTLCFLLWLYLNKNKNRKFILISLSILGLLILAVLVYWHPSSVYGRFLIWYICLLMIFTKPFGWGAHAFDKHIVEFQAHYLSDHSPLASYITYDVVHSPFNEFLFIGVRFGIISLLFYIFLVVAVFRTTYRMKSKLIYPLVVFLTISLTYFPFKITPLVVLVIPVIAFISTKSDRLIKIKVPVTIQKAILYLLLLVSSFIVIYEIQNFINYKRWQRAVSYAQERTKRDYSEELFNNLYPKMNNNGRFLITFPNLKYIQGDKANSLQLLEQADNYFCDIVLSLKMAKLYQELGYI